MTDHATPNLPAIDFEETSLFWRMLGFAQRGRSEGWMILERGRLRWNSSPSQTSGKRRVHLAVALGSMIWILFTDCAAKRTFPRRSRDGRGYQNHALNPLA